jgi:AcrR family transcriptional regulator
MNADLNYGKIIEKVIRRDSRGISQISRKLNVSRRTLYNWFESEKLDFEIIIKIGLAIGYDFSIEIPDFEEKKKNHVHLFPEELTKAKEHHSTTVYYWMEKYISLLERYNTVLRQQPL